MPALQKLFIALVWVGTAYLTKASKVEFTAHGAVTLVSSQSTEAMQAAFAAMDLNKDGVVTFAEFCHNDERERLSQEVARESSNSTEATSQFYLCNFMYNGAWTRCWMNPNVYQMATTTKAQKDKMYDYCGCGCSLGQGEKSAAPQGQCTASHKAFCPGNCAMGEGNK